MPLEVQEIGITMQVHDGGSDVPRPGQNIERDGLDKERREELIQECVRRVLDALRAERER